MATWRIRSSNGEHAPVNSRELRHMARDGRLQPDDLVMRDGMSTWAAAGKVKGLFESAAQNAVVPEEELVPAELDESDHEATLPDEDDPLAALARAGDNETPTPAAAPVTPRVTSARQTVPTSSKRGKDLRWLAKVLLHLSAIGYLIAGIGTGVMFWTAEIYEGGSKSLTMFFGFVFFFIFLLLAVGVELIVRGLNRGRNWALALGRAFFILMALGPGILFGILGLWALFAQGSIEAFHRDAQKHEQKIARRRYGRG